MLFFGSPRAAFASLWIAIAVIVAKPAYACAKEGLLGGIGLGAGARAFGSPDADLRQYRIAVMPELRLDDAVAVGPVLTMTQTNVTLRHGPQLPLDASLTLPWEPTLGARFEADLYRCPWFRVSLTGEFEHSLSRSRARVNRMNATDELADAIAEVQLLLNAGRDLGMQYGQSIPDIAGIVPHALTSGIGLSTEWGAMQAEVVLGARWRFLEPTLGLGVLRLQQSTRVDVLPALRQILDEYDISLRTRYATDTAVPLIAPGIRVDLWGGADLRLRGVWLSTKEFSFSTFDGAIFVPIDF